MRQWVLDAEHILDGSWAETPERHDDSGESTGDRVLTNKEVEVRFDEFIQKLEQKRGKDEMSQTERKGLTEFLRVLGNLRPHLIQCYDRADFPRTNNEMEGAIRKIKTRYRRISGRKKWGTYLIRHGRNIAFYEWWATNTERWQKFEVLAQKMDRKYWKQIKKETLSAQNEQLNQFRFLHHREALLASLEERWAVLSRTSSLH